jgi:enoyl-CoA hydratase/carnithine racemase
MYDEIYDLVERIEAEASLKVVTFESAHPEFFLAHYGIAESSTRFEKPRWIEAATRLAMSKTLSIAIIRGRVRGGGSEFAMACDVRFASLEKAIFGQPEVGFGLIPGGGALERLPLLVGRHAPSRLSSAPTISMPTLLNAMAGSTAPYRRRSSTGTSPILCDVSCHSIARR